MPRAFPTQIAKYLGHVFKREALMGIQAIGTVQQYAGEVAAFLELYDRLPYELVRLSAEDSAALTASVGAIRFGIDQWRNGNNSDCLRPVGPALATAWGLIEKLKDEAPSTAHDLDFIGDAVLREMIGLDLAAIATDLQSGEWKSATILAGSCCEALLLYGLQTIETKKSGTIAAAVAAITWRGKKAPNAADLTDHSWDLFSYAAVARETQLISENTKSEIDPARDYRNLIHPAKTIREKVRYDRGTAFVGAGAVDHVVSDLKKNL